jgi:hypothetical protein
MSDKLFSTKSIPSFKFKDVNRYKFYPKNIEKIRHSMRRIGRNVTPVIVSSDNYIIDGQHRVKAFNMEVENGSNVTLYYIKLKTKWDESESEFRDILKTVNSESVQWRILDWINFYAQGGNQNYIDLLNMWENDYSNFNMTSLAQLTHSAYLGGNVTRLIQDGKYEYSLDVSTQYLLDQISDLIDRKSFFAQRGFIAAVLAMRTNPTFDAKRLFKKIRSQIATIIPQSGQGPWEAYLCEIYNKNHRGTRLKPRTKAY